MAELHQGSHDDCAVAFAAFGRLASDAGHTRYTDTRTPSDQIILFIFQSPKEREIFCIYAYMYQPVYRR